MLSEFEIFFLESLPRDILRRCCRRVSPKSRYIKSYDPWKTYYYEIDRLATPDNTALFDAAQKSGVALKMGVSDPRKNKVVRIGIFFESLPHDILRRCCQRGIAQKSMYEKLWPLEGV